MRWSRIFSEVDNEKLTFSEFVVQYVVVGGVLITAFWLAGYVG